MSDVPLAVAYYRRSSDKQDMSIPDQKAKVSAWAKGRYRIVQEYVDDAKSGSKDTDKREDFLRMVNDLTIGQHAGKVRYVVSVDKSRFDRLDTLKGAKFKQALREAGVKFDSPMNGLIDWSTAIGRIMDTVLSEANHTTPLLIAEKGLQGRIRVTKAGRPNQTTPYGMAKKVKSPTGEEIVVHRGQRFATPKTWDSEFCPGVSAEVEAMRFLYATFDREDISYNELARRMCERKFPPPGTTKEWHGDTLCWMLRNPVYAGGLRIGETPKGEFFQTRGDKETPASEAAREREPVYVWGCHEGIIEKALWDRVQAKIKRNYKVRRPPRNRGPYALSGIIHCGKCGKPMYGTKNEQGRVVYRCHRSEISATSCGYWIAYEEQILPILLGDFLHAIREEIIKETSKSEVIPLNDEVAKLRKELTSLEAKIEQGREAVLEAPKNLRPGLMTTLEKRERQKAELEERIRQEAGQTKGGRLLEWWQRYRQEFFDSCPIDVSEIYSPGEHPLQKLAGGADEALIHYGLDDPRTGDPGAIRSFDSGLHAVPRPSTDTVLVVKTKIPASILREKLKRIDTKVYAWFKRKTKGRGYDLHKLRVKAYIDGAVCYEYSSNAAS